jgi:DNA topoisomerase-1
MAPAVYDTVAVDLIPANDKVAVLRANGSTLVEPGYLAVYIEGTDDVKEDEDDRLLPAMNVGDMLSLLNIRTAQHFTEPPPRYSEASLVKALEEFGIGRPSTYASIIQTLLGKKYCELDNRRFIPAIWARSSINSDPQFRALRQLRLHRQDGRRLDEIVDGHAEWVQVLIK